MPTAVQIRSFILTHYAGELKRRGLSPEEVPGDFDLLTNGIVDSLGVLDLVGALEDGFGIQIDLADLDADSLTVVGPLSEYVAANAVRRGGDSAPALQ